MCRNLNRSARGKGLGTCILQVTTTQDGPCQCNESLLPPNLCIFGFKGIAITLIFALNKTMLVCLVYCFDTGLCSQVGFPGVSTGKESACSAGDLGCIPGWGRSPGGGNSYPLQNSCLENSMDCIVHGVAKSRTRLSNFHLCSRVACC